MFYSDLNYIFQWWLAFFVIGIIFLPLTVLIFNNFFDRGYIFAKIIGMVFISYFIFLFGTLGIFSLSQLTVILTMVYLLGFNLLLLSKYPSVLISIKNSLKIFLLEEVIFLSALAFWSFVRANQPDIQGLEKFMDFGFVNSILRSDSFPPKDMWFTPFPINYYYFGHLITAVLTKLTNIPSFITYNLMLATLFAFTFSAVFSIGSNLIRRTALIKTQDGADQRLKSAFIGGILSAFLVSFAGNLHTIYAFFKPYVNENPVSFWQLAFSPSSFPNSYWYPNATRFIHNTIHEFPIYSFVVSDLHGHVLDIPIVLLTIAVLLSLIFNFQFSIFNQNKNLNFKNLFQISNLKFKILLISFLLAVMYMTNVWDGIIYFLLTSIVLLYIIFRQAAFGKEIKNQKSKIKNTIQNSKLFNFSISSFIFHLFPRSAIQWTSFILFLGIAFFIFSLPFSLSFKPFASNVGVLCAPQFLTDIGKLGPFLFEADHCQRSPLWQLMILYGFFYFWVGVFLVEKFKIKNLKLKIENLSAPDIFILILVLLSTLLIIIPEFIYIKDIYPAHYRANTMFKLVYQAFIMLSIASSYIILRSFLNLKSSIVNHSYGKLVYLIIGIIGLFLVMIYPYFATMSYYGELKTYKGLNGISYLKNLYLTDYEAILWINKNVQGQPVILEAQGDSYTDYARVSTHTGLPTVLGWTVHEWLWRGSYDVPSPRITDVSTLYETTDIIKAKELIAKYNISLVFIGDLERKKYLNLNEKKFNNLGTIIYQNRNTRIYKIY